MTTGVFGHGYEGRNISEYVADLKDWQVRTVVDVRLNAISRKKGFSKRALSEALSEVGIEYLHRPVLGNPKDNREGFWAPGTCAADVAHKRFRSLLSTQEAACAIDEITELARSHRVVLLCFEASESRCHRSLILQSVHDKLFSLSSI